jgi:hypothetical protein
LKERPPPHPFIGWGRGGVEGYLLMSYKGNYQHRLKYINNEENKGKYIPILRNKNQRLLGKKQNTYYLRGGTGGRVGIWIGDRNIDPVKMVTPNFNFTASLVLGLPPGMMTAVRSVLYTVEANLEFERNPT